MYAMLLFTADLHCQRVWLNLLDLLNRHRLISPSKERKKKTGASGKGRFEKILNASIPPLFGCTTHTRNTKKVLFALRQKPNEQTNERTGTDMFAKAICRSRIFSYPHFHIA